MIIKLQKVVIVFLCIAFLLAIIATVTIRLVNDVPGFISLSEYEHSGNLPHLVNGLININTATAEQLQTIPGIGPGLSKRITDDRLQNGPFESTEDIMRVKGIGQKTYDNIKTYITVGG